LKNVHEKACEKKRTFNFEDQAIRATEVELKRRKIRCKVYVCRVCGKWHIARKLSKLKSIRRRKKREKIK